MHILSLFRACSDAGRLGSRAGIMPRLRSVCDDGKSGDKDELAIKTARL